MGNIKHVYSVCTLSVVIKQQFNHCLINTCFLKLSNTSTVSLQRFHLHLDDLLEYYKTGRDLQTNPCSEKEKNQHLDFPTWCAVTCFTFICKINPLQSQSSVLVTLIVLEKPCFLKWQCGCTKTEKRQYLRKTWQVLTYLPLFTWQNSSASSLWRVLPIILLWIGVTCLASVTCLTSGIILYPIGGNYFCFLQQVFHTLVLISITMSIMSVFPGFKDNWVTSYYDIM